MVYKIILSIICLVLMLILTVENINRFRDMSNLYENAVKVSPFNVRAKYNYAITQIMKKNFSGAIKELEEISKIEPNYSRSHIWRLIADCYNEIGQVVDAKKYYTKILFLTRAEDLDVINKLVVIYWTEKDVVKTKWLLKRGLEIDPNNAVYYNSLGLCYIKEKKYLDAIESFEQAIKFEQGYTEAWFNLINLYEKLGNKKKVIEKIDQMAKIYLENNWLEKLEKY